MGTPSKLIPSVDFLLYSQTKNLSLFPCLVPQTSRAPPIISPPVISTIKAFMSIKSLTKLKRTKVGIPIRIIYASEYEYFCFTTIQFTTTYLCVKIPSQMINSTELKNGVTFLHHDKPCKVIEYSLIKMGRGGATVKLRVRNMETGAVEPVSMSSNVKVDEVVTNKKRLQYLFKDATTATFMDPVTFDQVEIPASVIENELPFIKEGDNVDVLFWNDKPLSVDIAPKVVLKVVETDPGVKGNTVSNLYKPAKLENGINIKVPLFINAGELIRVDTRTSSYIERAK